MGLESDILTATVGIGTYEASDVVWTSCLAWTKLGKEVSDTARYAHSMPMGGPPL